MSRRLLVSNDGYGHGVVDDEDIDDYEAGHISYDDDNDDDCNDDDDDNGDNVFWNDSKSNLSYSIFDGGRADDEYDRVVDNGNGGRLVSFLNILLL